MNFLMQSSKTEGLSRVANPVDGVLIDLSRPKRGLSPSHDKQHLIGPPPPRITTMFGFIWDFRDTSSAGEGCCVFCPGEEKQRRRSKTSSKCWGQG